MIHEAHIDLMVSVLTDLNDSRVRVQHCYDQSIHACLATGAQAARKERTRATVTVEHHWSVNRKKVGSPMSFKSQIKPSYFSYDDIVGYNHFLVNQNQNAIKNNQV